MILKAVKIGSVSVVGLGLAGGLLFGTDAGSYIWTSARSVRAAAKDAVPVEFELQRAHDLLEEIIPEMHANVRLIAQEEVEIAQLKADIEHGDLSMADEQVRIAKLRDVLNTRQVSYTLGEYDYTREQVKRDLARRFDRFKEAQVVHAGKRRLLESRQQSLVAAMQMLERTRGQKAHLEDQITALESQHRLVKAASVGSRIQVDNSKLAQTEKLIGQIKKRLDVAERVLAHESRFVQPIQIDVISEEELLAQVDEHFSESATGTTTADDESLKLSRAGVEDRVATQSD